MKQKLKDENTQNTQQYINQLIALTETTIK